MDATSYRVNVGGFKGVIIKDGGSSRTAAAFLPDAPKEELEAIVRQHNLDPNNLESSINIFCFQTDTHNILVDTGLGTSNLPGKLEAEGVYASAIDTVIITHGHGDHINGILNAEGGFVYPNAQYIIWQTEWDYWTAAGRFAEGDTNPSQGIWKALKAHQDRVTTIGGNTAEAEVVPGVCAIAAPGHTIGHIALLIESGGEKLLHIADAAHYPFQMDCPQWSPNFDYDKNQAVATRKAVFERAEREQAVLQAYHFTFPGQGRVIDGNWQPVE